MNKKLILIGGGGLVVVVGAAFFIVGSAGVPKAEPNYDAIRGTEAYYSGAEEFVDLAEFMGNLKGSQTQRFVKLALTVVFRTSPESADAASVFVSQKAAIMDRLHLIFNGKSLEDIDGAERKELIKEEIKGHLQLLLFPDKKARIERVLYREFFVQ